MPGKSVDGELVIYNVHSKETHSRRILACASVHGYLFSLQGEALAAEPSLSPKVGLATGTF